MLTKNDTKMNLEIFLYRLIFFSSPYLAFGLGYFVNTQLYGMPPFEAIVVSAAIALGCSNLLTYSALKLQKDTTIRAKCNCNHVKAPN